MFYIYIFLFDEVDYKKLFYKFKHQKNKKEIKEKTIVISLFLEYKV